MSLNKCIKCEQEWHDTEMLTDELCCGCAADRLRDLEQELKKLHDIHHGRCEQLAETRLKLEEANEYIKHLLAKQNTVMGLNDQDIQWLKNHGVKVGSEVGTEEGQKCNRGGCDGDMGYHPVENCSCHINPPCSACVDNPLVCLKCGVEIE